jgi:hypothetical protein
MANTWSIITPITGGVQAIETVDTTQNHPLGLRVHAVHADYGVAEFIYCKGVASVIATDWCTIAEDFTLVRLVANAIGPVGIAMSAIDAVTDYGWVCIYGKVPGGSGAAIADGAQIYAHGTAGLVDDAVVDGDMVHNALCRSTISGAAITGLFQIWYPYTDDIASND